MTDLEFEGNQPGAVWGVHGFDFVSSGDAVALNRSLLRRGEPFATVDLGQPSGVADFERLLSADKIARDHHVVDEGPARVLLVKGLPQLVDSDLQAAFRLGSAADASWERTRGGASQVRAVFVVPSAWRDGRINRVDSASSRGAEGDHLSPRVMGPEAAAHLACELRRAGWTVVEVDVSTVSSSVDLFILLKQVLWFPDFFGSGWDSMNDALDELSEGWPFPLLLVMRGVTRMMANNVTYAFDAVVTLDVYETTLTNRGLPIRIVWEGT